MSQIQEEQVYETIRTAIENIRTLAKFDLRNQWRGLKTADRCRAARALVYMGSVAENPAQYFSRRKTDLSWRNRAIDYVRQNSLADDQLAQAYLIVPGPADLVAGRTEGAMLYNGALSRSYYLLCKEITDWEYNRTSKNPANQARVPQNVEKIQHMADQTDRLIAATNTTLLANLRKFLQKNK
ncbi:hypothetical protein HDR63_03425 [bacterium]|nr:hypothetical protein [bacterium]